MGLTDAEFGRLTPAMFEALLDRKQKAERRAHIRAGIIAAAVYNANPFRDKNAKVVSPLDFLPEEQPIQQTLQEQVKTVTAAFGCGPTKRGK